MKSTIFTLAATLWTISFGSTVFAQTDPLQFLGPFANLSATALLGWYLWYDTAHGKPKLHQIHHSTVEQITTDFHRQLQLVREDFHRQMAAQRDFYRELSNGPIQPENPAD